MDPVLTAVLAADIVGYSRLMGDDTKGTLDKLKDLRSEIIGPAIAANRGKMVKSLGDGWIVTFGAVANAVRCAMQIQDRLKTESSMQINSGLTRGRAHPRAAKSPLAAHSHSSAPFFHS